MKGRSAAGLKPLGLHFPGTRISLVEVGWGVSVVLKVTRKDPDGGKDCGQEEKEVTEDEMLGWHH